MLGCDIAKFPSAAQMIESCMHVWQMQSFARMINSRIAQRRKASGPVVLSTAEKASRAQCSINLDGC